MQSSFIVSIWAYSAAIPGSSDPNLILDIGYPWRVKISNQPLFSLLELGSNSSSMSEIAKLSFLVLWLLCASKKYGLKGEILSYIIDGGASLLLGNNVVAESNLLCVIGMFIIPGNFLKHSFYKLLLPKYVNRKKESVRMYLHVVLTTVRKISSFFSYSSLLLSS